ncbi:dephospho-CoA kinase [bacterium]|nr:dephospho-CoA kinase [bacterium]
MKISGQKASCRKIGVTGGTGTGKSVFSREFGRMGACVIDADAVARELTDQDEGIRRKLIRTFGLEMFDRGGRLKRTALADRVFSDQKELEKLNRILWPPLKKVLRQKMAGCLAEDPERPVVVDAAILFDAGMAPWFDHVFVIESTLSKRISRLMECRNWTREQAMKRILGQPRWGSSDPVLPRRGVPSVIRIRNSGSEPEWKVRARSWYRKCIMFA